MSVNEIYKKLGALVYEQSHTVDSIEASVEHTSVFVAEGVQQLKQASHYQVSDIANKLIGFLNDFSITAVFVAVILEYKEL